MAKNIQPNERDFQNWVKENWHSWKTQVHPGMGSDAGIPDLLILTESLQILPCELKIGSLENEKTLWSKAIRPSQVQWHGTLARSGGYSIILIGVWSGNHWRVFVVDGAFSSQWKDGFSIASHAYEIDGRDFFSAQLEDFCEKLLLP